MAEMLVLPGKTMVVGQEKTAYSQLGDKNPRVKGQDMQKSWNPKSEEL